MSVKKIRVGYYNVVFYASGHLDVENLETQYDADCGVALETEEIIEIRDFLNSILKEEEGKE